MTNPSMRTPRLVGPETFLLGTDLPMPLGTLPVHAYLIRGRQPVLIDTGIPALGDGFVRQLGTVIDPKDIAWIYLTHVDLDHVGALDRLLELSPRARLVTTFVGMAKLSLNRAIPPERIFLLNPGQRLDAGDRQLLVSRPVVFDAPETTTLFDPATRTLFSADSFGGVLPGSFEDAAAVPAAALRDGMITWATIDAPWLHRTSEAAMGRFSDEVRALAPERVLSAHMPPAGGSLLETLLGNVAAAREAPPFVGPDQAGLEQLLAGAA